MRLLFPFIICARKRITCWSKTISDQTPISICKEKSFVLLGNHIERSFLLEFFLGKRGISSLYHFLDKIPGLLPETSTEINWFQNSLLLYNSFKLLQSSLSLFLMPAVGVYDNIFHVFFFLPFISKYT